MLDVIRVRISFNPGSQVGRQPCPRQKVYIARIVSIVIPWFIIPTGWVWSRLTYPDSNEV